jgi:hypothetical protein
MAQDRIIAEVQGIIACGNDRGVKLVGADKWVNVSKFSDGVIIPPVGTSVVLGIDKAGYVREVTTAPAAPQDAAQAPEQAATASTVPPSKDSMIARMNSITNAIAIVTSNGPAAIAEVLRVAATLEGWILR